MPLPPWLSEKLDSEGRLNNKLTQCHVVETMYEAERPYFSLQQIHQRIQPDVSKVTVRNRLEELEDLGIVATERYPDSLTLYFLDHPESEWPLSPEGKRAIEDGTVEGTSPIVEFFQQPQVRLVLREEFWRSVAWAAFSLFGWAIIVNATDQLAATAWTVLGLPLLTTVSLTVGMIALRLWTGSSLQVQSKEGLHVVTLAGAVIGGFWGLFAIFALEKSPVVVLVLYGLATGVYLVYYTRVILPRFDGPLDG